MSCLGSWKGLAQVLSHRPIVCLTGNGFDLLVYDSLITLSLY